MINSWKPALKAVAKRFHDANQSIIINDHCHRIDMMADVDGIYAEMGDLSGSGYLHGVGSALAGLNRPVVLWNHGQDTNVSHLELGLQASLLLGVYPTVPVRNNDHSIGGECAPHCPYDQLFQDYGPLFQTLRGKEWVLLARPARVVQGHGVANLFRTGPRAFTAVFVGTEAGSGPRDTVSSGITLQLRLPDGLRATALSALLPGGSRQEVRCWGGARRAFSFPHSETLSTCVPMILAVWACVVRCLCLRLPCLFAIVGLSCLLQDTERVLPDAAGPGGSGVWPGLKLMAVSLAPLS